MGMVQQRQNETAKLSAHRKSLNIVTGKTEAMTFKQHCPKTLKTECFLRFNRKILKYTHHVAKTHLSSYITHTELSSSWQR